MDDIVDELGSDAGSTTAFGDVSASPTPSAPSSRHPLRRALTSQATGMRTRPPPLPLPPPPHPPCRRCVR